jgi:hypothetical protein
MGASDACHLGYRPGYIPLPFRTIRLPYLDYTAIRAGLTPPVFLESRSRVPLPRHWKEVLRPPFDPPAASLSLSIDLLRAGKARPGEVPDSVLAADTSKATNVVHRIDTQVPHGA